jgi:hypothetical protein
VTEDRRQLLIKAGLWYLALTSAYVAVWILVAPGNFYDEFPTGPGEWVSKLPPYNEHLERDYGAAGLGLAVLAALAAIWRERRLVQATAIAFAVGTAPHLVYHSTTTESSSTGDNIQQLGALALPVLIAAGLLYLTAREA